MLNIKFRYIVFKLIILLLIGHSFANAQQSNYESNYRNFSFLNFGPNQGLTSSAASCAIQDKFGIMWIGTSDGLYKFDGYNFVGYNFNPEDKNSISGNIINCLLEDKLGNIWVGTDNGGLCMFDRKSNNFYRYEKLYWKKEMYKMQSISSLLQDKNGNIWFSNSQFQYFILNPNTKEIYPLKYDLLDRTPDYYRTTNMLEDKNGVVWLATQFGLYYSLSNYQSAQGSFMVEKIYKKIPDLKFQCILPHSNSTDSIYLVTTDGMILSFNINTATYHQRFKDLTERLKKNKETVQYAILDNDNNWWIGTYRNGLYYYDNINHNIQNLKHEVFNTNSLSYDFVNNLYKDNKGYIWVCTDGGGVSLINTQASMFNVFQNNPLNENTLCHNDVWSIYDHEEFTLIGTSLGISYYDKSNNTFKKIQFLENGFSNIAFYSCIVPDIDGSFLVGTDGEGLLRLRLPSGKLERVVFDDLLSEGVSGYSISCIAPTATEIWVGTFNEGLIRYNRATKKTKVYKHTASSQSIAQNSISSLLFISENELWISLQDNGINRMDVENEHFFWISTTSKKTGHLSSDVVICVNKDSYGTIWASTERGINAINPENNKVFTYNKIPGGSIDIVYSTLEDKNKNLWISTNKGIYAFKLPTPEQLFDTPDKAHQIIENSIINFDEHDGLPANEFNQGAYFVDSNGIICFGGIKGMVSFNPKNILQNNSIPPTIYFESFNLFEKKLVLDTIFNLKKRIKLKYNQNYFSIDLVSPSYLSNNKTYYKYILEGLDKAWLTMPYPYKISYHNIAPGKYTFRVKVTDSNGRWTQDEKSFEIIITPPYYQTIAFYFIVSALIILIVFGYIKLRERNLKKENRILEEKIELRTRDVTLHKEIVEQKSAELGNALSTLNENILYANKIKQAILPDVKEIRKLFPETFLIYKPRYVVSGDLYFFSRQETSRSKPKYAVMGIADCTGHGVSGALISVIASTLINDIVNLKGIIKPAHILDELQIGVKEILKINETNNYEVESMRCALCKFDFENNLMEYAGARFPIYVVRNNKLFELKGDRMLIGAGSANLYERFTENTFKVENGDYIYMLTDGFANQFGGNYNKKFKTKRIKEMLLSLHTTSHVIQEEQINLIFNQWIGKNEQIDDILIIGYKYTNL
ncbi:MAG: SpoIIE family protein phosphatase [Bacteroidia bacterium]|nr:SpoIIE family protein phosphatase [Bacteroidia bacterium]MCZ2249788.1 SpoIIE family protein phosphatase [Bacteroidia bacterium]